MKKRTFLILAAAFSIFPIDAYAVQGHPNLNPQELKSVMKQQLAQHHSPHRKRQNKGERMNKILQQLDLIAEQSRRIETINQEFQTKNVALDEEIQNLRQVMNSPLASDASTEELRQQHQRVQALHQQLGDNRFEMMLQVREVLTSEQRVQLEELIEQKRNQRRSR